MRIKYETERKHLPNAMFIKGENEDPEDCRSDVRTNIEFQDSDDGTLSFLTCAGDGWKDSTQKGEFIQQCEDALED